MAETLPDYLIGDKGVNIVASPLHTPDGGLLSAQNVEFIRDAGIGGIGSRGGIAPLNSVALAGSVLALANVPLVAPPSVGLMIGMNTGETPTWKTSTDGTTFTNLTSSQIARAASVGKSPSGLGAGAITVGQRPASLRDALYFCGDNYVQYPTIGHTAPVIDIWNGTLSFEQFRIPMNPTATASSNAIWISDVYVINGIIYLSVYDAGGAAPNHKGRVLSCDPTTGALAEVGNRFGNGTGENTAGFPMCLTNYLGLLWAGTYGVSGNNQGKVYWIRPGIDETWTLDLTGTLHNGYFMSLCAFQGNLYAATDADASGTAIIQARTSTGTWSTSLTAPDTNQTYYSSLIVFNNELYAAYYKSGVRTLLKKFDGSSWTTDLDVGVTYAIKPSGQPYLFRGKLYWPFLGNDAASSTAGFLLQRTTAGVWTRVLNGVGVLGGVGQYTPSS